MEVLASEIRTMLLPPARAHRTAGTMSTPQCLCLSPFKEECNAQEDASVVWDIFLLTSDMATYRDKNVYKKSFIKPWLSFMMKAF
jgi:hypothetical protein